METIGFVVAVTFAFACLYAILRLLWDDEMPNPIG